jgi:hypothetical protein
MAGFNRAVFRRELSPQLKNKTFPVIKRRMETFFEREKGRMIREFDEHEVTRELISGVTIKSKFLDGEGSLPGLLGYDNIEGEVFKVASLLESSSIVSIRQGRIGSDGTYRVTARTDVPSVKLLNEETPLPWGPEKGLVDAIELGVSGFFNTLFGTRFKSSRSGGGIQVKQQVRDISFRGTGRGSYLRGILSRFLAKIRSGPRAQK